MNRIFGLLIGLVLVGIIATGCSSGAKSVTVTGPDYMLKDVGANFSATAVGAAPLFGQVAFVWTVNGKQLGSAYVVTPDATGTAVHERWWKPTSTGTFLLTVTVALSDPGTSGYDLVTDDHTVIVVAGQ